MKVKFTAEIIDDNGNVVGKRTSEEGGIPSMEEFDLSTKEGFLRDFDSLEKAVLKARNQIGVAITDEILDGTLKKNCMPRNRERKTEVESELGRIPVSVLNDMAQSIQPKERLYSTSYLQLSCKLCTKLSYRDAAEMRNLFQHRDVNETVKLRTFSDCVGRIGDQISKELEKTTGRILKLYGFDSETGLPMEGVRLSSNITSPVILEQTEADRQSLSGVMDTVNAFRDEKIPFTAEELDMESAPSECVYVSIDDIGVKHQKDSRSPDAEKGAKYVEHTVIHIQHGQGVYVLTACGMKNAMRSMLAFLIFNGLLQNRLVFFTDGARNIKSSIEEMFSFHPYTVILDWYHLKKKCQELLSMAMKGRDARNNTLEKLLRILWVGDVKRAVSYLESLPASIIKNQTWLDEQINYLKRKEYSITCYAVRAGLGLRNSSNPVEKENDILVARRQKHNGMSWSKHGSSALATIEMIYQNGYEDIWFRYGRISFVMPKKERDSLNLCA